MIDNAETAFPAFRRFFRSDLPPLLRSLDPFLRNVNPLLMMIRDYRAELTALLGNASAGTNGSVTGDRARYLRTMATLSPDRFATFPQRTWDQPHQCLPQARPTPSPAPSQSSRQGYGAQASVSAPPA